MLTVTHIAIVSAALQAAAQPRAPEPRLRVGDEVRLIVPAVVRGWLDARVLGLRHDTLRIETRTFRQRYLALSLAEIRMLEVDVSRRRHRVGRAAAVGGAIGAVAGLIWGVKTSAKLVTSCEEFLSPSCMMKGMTHNVAPPAIGAGAGAALGGLAVAAVTSATTESRWLPIPVATLVGTTITEPESERERHARPRGANRPWWVRVLTGSVPERRVVAAGMLLYEAAIRAPRDPVPARVR